jgi:hypothetical protein
MMADAFSGVMDSVSSPATRAVAVMPHDVNALADIPKALFVGTGGTVVARGIGGGPDAAFKNLAAGTILPLRAQFVRGNGHDRPGYRGALLMLDLSLTGVALRHRQAALFRRRRHRRHRRPHLPAR